VIGVAVAENVPLRWRFWDGASRQVLDRCHTQAQQRGCFQGGLGISLGEALSLHGAKPGMGMYRSVRSH
jgi:hypothetical protein